MAKFVNWGLPPDESIYDVHTESRCWGIDNGDVDDLDKDISEIKMYQIMQMYLLGMLLLGGMILGLIRIPVIEWFHSVSDTCGKYTASATRELLIF